MVAVNLFFELLSWNEICVDELRVWAQRETLGADSYMRIRVLIYACENVCG